MATEKAARQPRIVDVLDLSKSLEENDEAVRKFYEAEAKKGLDTVLASAVTVERVVWLWHHWLPLGALSVLAGEPGQGKSTLALDIAAKLSMGNLAGELKGQPANSVVAMVEDGTSITVVPRLQAAGADLDRVHIVRFQTSGFNLEVDTQKLRNTIEAHDARFVVLDPLLAYIPRSVDAYKDQHVRGVLAPLAQAAEETGAAIVGVLHLNKSDGKEVLSRIAASVGFVGAARSVLLVGPDQDGGEYDHVLAQAKANLGPKPTALKYRTEGMRLPVPGDDKPTEVTRLAWTGEATGVTADELVMHVEPGARQGAEEFLRDLLRAGPVRVADMESQAKAMDITKRTLERARRGLGVEPFRPKVPGPWYVRLPVTSSRTVVAEWAE